MDPVRLRRAVTVAAVGLAAAAAVGIAQDPLPSAGPDPAAESPAPAAAEASPEARVAALEARLAGRLAEAERLVRARASGEAAGAGAPVPIAPASVVAVTSAPPVTSSASS
jgi:hypothetical protein